MVRDVRRYPGDGRPGRSTPLDSPTPRPPRAGIAWQPEPEAVRNGLQGDLRSDQSIDAEGSRRRPSGQQAWPSSACCSCIRVLVGGGKPRCPAASDSSSRSLDHRRFDLLRDLPPTRGAQPRPDACSAVLAMCGCSVTRAVADSAPSKRGSSPPSEFHALSASLLRLGDRELYWMVARSANPLHGIAEVPSVGGGRSPRADRGSRRPWLRCAPPSISEERSTVLDGRLHGSLSERRLNAYCGVQIQHGHVGKRRSSPASSPAPSTSPRCRGTAGASSRQP